jgi:hypothetical protein
MGATAECPFPSGGFAATSPLRGEELMGAAAEGPFPSGGFAATSPLRGEELIRSAYCLTTAAAPFRSTYF